MKQKTHPTKKSKEGNELFTIKISKEEIERKVRKSYPPSIQVHKDKTAYKRKLKHPKKEEE